MTSFKPLQFVTAVVFFAGIGLSVFADNLRCEKEDAGEIQCKSTEVKKPTWWGWLTESSSTQFHFFDLIELMYGDDTPYQKDFSDNRPHKGMR